MANSSFGSGAPSENTSYAEKLVAQFRADLQNVQASKPKKCSDIVAEGRSAAETGKVTDRLKKMRDALLSVQASSVKAQRAFSMPGWFVTKIRIGLETTHWIVTVCYHSGGSMKLNARILHLTYMVYLQPADFLPFVIPFIGHTLLPPGRLACSCYGDLEVPLRVLQSYLGHFDPLGESSHHSVP